MLYFSLDNTRTLIKDVVEVNWWRDVKVSDFIYGPGSTFVAMGTLKQVQCKEDFINFIVVIVTIHIHTHTKYRYRLHH